MLRIFPFSVFYLPNGVVMPNGAMYLLEFLECLQNLIIFAKNK